MGDFIADNLGWVIVVLIVFLFMGMAATASKQEEQKKVFMASCTQDHKQYECDVMWGQTRESKATAEMAQNIAIGAAAGAIAGSAGRR